MMGTHPTKVVATGGAAWRPREELYGNIYDHISSDFTYANGMQMSSYCRQFDKAKNQKIATNISERVVGTKGRHVLAVTGGGGQHNDVHYGARIGVLRTRDYVGSDYGVAA